MTSLLDSSSSRHAHTGFCYNNKSDDGAAKELKLTLEEVLHE